MQWLSAAALRFLKDFLTPCPCWFFIVLVVVVGGGGVVLDVVVDDVFNHRLPATAFSFHRKIATVWCPLVSAVWCPLHICKLTPQLTYHNHIFQVIL